MLYLFDEYVAEYPARAVAGLNYFLDSPKNLHEMSAEEISEVYNNTPEITEKTAAAHKSAIRLYLKWLLSRGIKCDPTVVQRVECNLSNKKFLIFSTEDLAYYQEVLKDYLTATAENGGKKISPVTLLMIHASGILSFYGLTEEEIVALRYDDVQPDGVRGYDLPLTDKDIRVLLDYKSCKAVNSRPLKGDGYIRSAQPYDINPTFMSRAVWRQKLDATHDYLKPLLRMNNLYQLGVFSRVFEYEKTQSKKLAKNAQTFDWFIDMACPDRQPNAVTATKLRYLEYREERIEKENLKPVEPKKTPLEEQLDVLIEQWESLGEEIKKFKKLIKR